MKLRNKLTDQVGNFIINKDHFECVDLECVPEYGNLAELNKEWEDAPEGPETHWMIDTSVLEPVREIAGNPYEINKEIGNWFSSKEEAEKAVEKLKALTEAKKDGLVIKGYYYNHDDLVVLADIGNCNKLTLDTLFGKEID